MNHEFGSEEPAADPIDRSADLHKRGTGAGSAGGGAAPSASKAVSGVPEPKPDLATRAKGWARKGLFVLIGIAVLVALYFILAAWVPRSWAQFVGRQVDGRMSSGTLTGLTLGAVCTFVPLLAFTLSVVNRGKLRNSLSWVFAVVGVITAIPNLLTLTVVLGRGNGAHAGQRILDVDGPGFRGASLIGAILGALVAAVAIYYIARYRLRGKKLRAAQGEAEPGGKRGKKKDTPQS